MDTKEKILYRIFGLHSRVLQHDLIIRELRESQTTKAFDRTLTRVKIIIVPLREGVIAQGQEPLSLLNSDQELVKQDLGLQVIKGKTLTQIIDLQAARRK